MHRPDAHLLRGRAFGRLWLAGAPAQKWTADADPEADAAGLQELVGHLQHVTADEVVLVSTVDVYADPVGVDEATPVSVDDHERAYGRNRLWLEGAVRQLFPRVLTLRLPGLYGPGLRKNLVFDLLHEREEFCHRDARFQFYDVRRLCDDADLAMGAGLDLVNLATAPVRAATLAQEVFGRRLVRQEGRPAAYDMRTLHASLYGGTGGYLAEADAVLASIGEWAATERVAR